MAATKKKRPATKSAKQERKFPGRLAILLCVVAAICLIISTSAIWFNRYIFKTSTFTSLTTTAILSESSRDAIATEISDKLLQNRPALKSVLDDRLVKLVSSLLDTDLSQKALDKTLTKLHTTITSKNPQSVAIDLSGIKGTITNVVSTFRERTNRAPEDYKIDLNDIPSEIVLVDASKFPNIYNIGTAIMWLGVATFLAGWGILAGLLIKARKSQEKIKKMLAIAGGILFVGGLIGLALGPLFKPTVMAQINSSNLRVVVENIYSSFTSKFIQVDLWVLIIPGLVLLAIALGYQLWPMFVEHRKKSRR